MTLTCHSWKILTYHSTLVIHSACRFCSIAALPVNDILQRLAFEKADQVFAKQVHTAVFRYVGCRGNVGRDDDALIVPQARIRWALEFTVVNVESDAAKLAFGQCIDQSIFIDY